MITLGDLELSTPVIPAPMAGVTDLPFRQILREYGAELVFTEMVSSHGLVQCNSRTESLLDIRPRDGYTGVQIFGADPEIMARAAERVEQEYTSDLIDINMGCPAPKVTGGGAGAALLRTPELACDIVKAVKKSVDLPVTAKLRKGWDIDDSSSLGLAEKLVDAGVDALALHGRTREQFYQGEADREVIVELVNRVEVPVIGNGDIFSAEDAERMLETTGCQAVMLARGIRGNPWLLRQGRRLIEKGRPASEPDYEEIIDQACNHLRRAVDYYGPERGVRIMRKHISWYLKGLPYCSPVKDRVNRIDSREEVEKELYSYLERLQKKEKSGQNS